MAGRRAPLPCKEPTRWDLTPMPRRAPPAARGASAAASRRSEAPGASTAAGTPTPTASTASTPSRIGRAVPTSAGRRTDSRTGSARSTLALRRSSGSAREPLAAAGFDRGAGGVFSFLPAQPRRPCRAREEPAPSRSGAGSVSSLTASDTGRCYRGTVLARGFLWARDGRELRPSRLGR